MLKKIEKRIEKKILKTMLNYRLKKYSPDLVERFHVIKNFAKKIGASEYHITNACNLRCKGCWFFEYDLDKKSKEEHNLEELEKFVIKEKQRGISGPLIIGGEPALYPDRIKIYTKHMPYVTISSNGLIKLPYEGFENVTIAISLFGGGVLDDKLRGHSPSGKEISGLLDKALENYRGDNRAGFVFALCIDGIDYIEETILKIRENGSRLIFNYYSSYDKSNPLQSEMDENKVLKKALEMKAKYPETVVSHPYFIEALIKGRTEWGTFGYESCPSISVDFEGNKERLQNGKPFLPKFNTYAADLETVQACCTHMNCDGCRDSQAVTSWLLVNFRHFLKSEELFKTWIEMSESYWDQFIWSPFNEYHKKIWP